MQANVHGATYTKSIVVVAELGISLHLCSVVREPDCCWEETVRDCRGNGCRASVLLPVGSNEMRAWSG